MPTLFERKNGPNVPIPLTQEVKALAGVEPVTGLQKAAGAVVRLLKTTEGLFSNSHPLHGLLKDACALVVALDTWRKAGDVDVSRFIVAIVDAQCTLMAISDDCERRKNLSRQFESLDQDEVTTIAEWREQLDRGISAFELHSHIKLCEVMFALEVPALRNLMQNHVLFSATHNIGDGGDTTEFSIFDYLIRWVEGSEDPERLLLLFGPSGSGKTTICRELCKQLQAAGVTIAHINPAFLTALEKAFEQNKAIFSNDLHEHFERFLLPVFQEASPALNPSSPILFVIDGLDECQDEELQSSVVQLCKDILPQLKPAIKVIIASRPVYNINITVEQRICVSVEVPLNDNFIRRLLSSAVNLIRSEQSFVDNWPSVPEMESLIQISSGIPIYATILMSYVRGARGGPEAALKYIIYWSSQGPYGLFILYHLVFKAARNLPLVRRVLELVLLYIRILPHHGLTTQIAADILRGTNIAEINDALQDVTSVVLLKSLKSQWDPNGHIQTISFFHPSAFAFFFLYPPDHAFTFNAKKGFGRTTSRCLSLLADNNFLTQRFHRGFNTPYPESFSMSERSIYHTILCHGLLELTRSVAIPEISKLPGIHKSLLSYDYSDINISFGYQRIDLNEYLVRIYRILITACKNDPDLIAHFQSIHQKCQAVVPGFKEYVESEAV